MQKKATMRLSVEAIVILILAIAFLGLGLAFLTGIFKSADTDFEGAFDSLTKYRIDQLRTSEKTFDLETYTFEIDPGQKKIFFMLLRNEDNQEKTYQITHGLSEISEKIDCNKIEINYKQQITIQPNSEAVPPLVIKASQDINKGTCFFEIKATSDTTETTELTVNVI